MANPTLKPSVFQNSSRDVAQLRQGEVMTIDGTVNKAIILLFIVIASAGYVWSQAFSGVNVQMYMMVGMIGALITAIVASFKPDWSPILAPTYSALKGVALGGISAYLNMRYPGIVLQAASLTFATAGGLFLAYKTRLIKVTDKFRSIANMAMFAVLGVYLLTFILGFFGVQIPMIHESGPIGVLFSLVVIGIAGSQLLIDFDFIERQATHNDAPKYMEWYSAFALMVTLAWLYLEMLRLLSKLRSRD